MRVAVVCCVLGFGLALTVPALAKEKIRLTAADMAAARAVVIRRADLRPTQGWKGGSVKPDFSTPVCPFPPRTSDLVVTGAAASNWHRPGRSLFTAVKILQNADMVRRDFKRATSLTGLGCLDTITAAAMGNRGARGGTIPFPSLTGPGERDASLTRYTAANGERQLLEEAVIWGGRSKITVAETVPAETPLDILNADVVRAARIMVSRIKA